MKKRDAKATIERDAKRKEYVAFLMWGNDHGRELRTLEDKMLDKGDEEWAIAIADLYLDHCEKEASNAAHS